MKKILATAIAAIALATAAELVPVELRDGVASVPAGKVAAIAACSTNLTGTATFKRITPLSYSWTETTETAITNTTYSGSGATNHTVRIVRTSIPRSFEAPLTNNVCSLTLAAGRAATNLTGIVALPGDLFLVSGLKGRAMLVIEQ